MSKLYAKLRRTELHAMQERIVHQALTATGRNIIGTRSAAADPARLRGIPAIGRNCPGHIPGTRPDHAITQRHNG